RAPRRARLSGWRRLSRCAVLGRVALTPALSRRAGEGGERPPREAVRSSAERERGEARPPLEAAGARAKREKSPPPPKASRAPAGRRKWRCRSRVVTSGTALVAGRSAAGGPGGVDVAQGLEEAGGRFVPGGAGERAAGGSGAKALAERGVVGQPGQRPGQPVQVARGGQQALALVLGQIREVAGPPPDHGQPERHRLA